MQNQPLTLEERNELEGWYAHMEAEEAEILLRSPNSKIIVELQTELNRAVRRLEQTTTMLSELREQNNKLREEVEELERKRANSLKTRINSDG